MITHRSRPLLPFSTPLPSSTFVQYGATFTFSLRACLLPSLLVNSIVLVFLPFFFSAFRSTRPTSKRKCTSAYFTVGSGLRQVRTMLSYVRTNEQANERMMNRAIISMTLMRRNIVNVYRIFVT